MTLHKIPACRVNRNFRGRQREDQPTLTNIDRAKPQDVAKKSSICIRILAVDKKVGTVNHYASIPQGRMSSRLPGRMGATYPRQQMSFNSVISSTANCGPSRPMPLFLTPP